MSDELTDRELTDRLRAVAPAAPEVDLDRLRARVAAEIEADEPEIARPTARRRQPWLAAAAAAAVLVAGGIGYGVGAQRAPTYTISAAGDEAATEKSLAAAVPESDRQVTPVDQYGNPVPGAMNAHWTAAADLSSAPQKAETLLIKPRFGAEQALVLAGAFGVQGEAHEQDGEYRVGGAFTLTADGTYTYSVAARDCPAEGCAELEPAEAVRRVRDIVAATGGDGDMDWQVERTETGLAVHGTPSASGSGYGVNPTWNYFEFVGDTLVFGNGIAADVQPHGEKDIISATDAVARLNDTRFTPVWALTSSWYSSPFATPNSAAPGEITWAAAEYVVSQAQLISDTGAAYADGSRLLTPYWLLTSPEGYTWTVPALTDAELGLH